MPTKHEQALEGLFLLLKNNIATASVLRNEAMPVKIPTDGLIILRDGNIGEASMSFSPMRYHYQHRSEIEVFIQKADQTERDTALDGLLQEIGQVLISDINLGGIVDYMHFEAPEFMHETIEGAPAIKAALVPVILEYSISHPLN